MPETGREAGPGWGLLAACVAGALLWRAPWLPFADLNWDSSMYRLMGEALLHGHAPYGVYWDRKPVGLFVLVALVQALGGTGPVALAVAASVSVGLGGWCLAGVARAMLPRLALAGPLAALLWIVFVGRNGGTGPNAELFFVPLNLAGLWVLLRARRDAGWFAAGLLFGLAFQVKYNSGFTVPAFMLAWALFGSGRFACVLGLVVAGGAVPTVAVLGWYGLVGQLGDWATANVLAHGQVLATALADPVPYFAVLGYELRGYDVPVIGTVLAAAWAVRDRRFAAVMAAWIVADLLTLRVLARLADHMVIQLLPGLCLAAGYGVARTLAAAGRWRLALAGLAVAAWLGLSGREMARPFAAAWEVAARRQAGEGAGWGDPSAAAGAVLRERMAPGAAVYVFGGPILGVYGAAGRAPPTRFPFVEHLWSGYAPVDGVAELERVLAERPAFVAVAEEWAPGGTVPAGAERVFAVLHAALARDYVADGTVGPFRSRGGGPIGPREGIALFRRAAH